MRIEVKVPQLPESVTEATLVNWHKKPGEPVKRDENLIDVEHNLVGLNVDQVLVAFDRFTGLLVPVDECRFGDRLRQLRHLHFDSHCFRFLALGYRARTISPDCNCSANASSISFFCSA